MTVDSALSTSKAHSHQPPRSPRICGGGRLTVTQELRTQAGTTIQLFSSQHSIKSSEYTRLTLTPGGACLNVHSTLQHACLVPSTHLVAQPACVLICRAGYATKGELSKHASAWSSHGGTLHLVLAVRTCVCKVQANPVLCKFVKKYLREPHRASRVQVSLTHRLLYSNACPPLTIFLTLVQIVFKYH